MSENHRLNEQEARQEIVKWGKEIYDRGLVNGTGGNLSIRLNEVTVLCTPSGWSLGHLTPESITKTTINGKVLQGAKPTKELPMHLAAYEARPDVSAVAHTHSAHAVAYACTMEPGHVMPPYAPSLPAKVGPVIQLASSRVPCDDR